MNTAAKPNCTISARFLGPVFSLDGELTKHAQNLIFARNGTGKSFLSRAFRYLDLHGQGADISKAAFNLVSDESPDGKGSFSFFRGADTVGSLSLQKEGDVVSVEAVDTIFHVFSEEFVHEELREREFSIDGEIENEIAVDSENIKIKGAEDAVTKAQAAAQTALEVLNVEFDKAKIEEVNEKAGVNKRLKEYTDLNIERILANYTSAPPQPKPSFADILKDLDSLKAIPAEPVYPEQLGTVLVDDIDQKAIEETLQRLTSPSSVSEDIKKKIEADHEFIKYGTKIVQESHSKECPFCEQNIAALDPKAIIDSYITYFADEEEKHKDVLRDFLRKLKRKEDELNAVEAQYGRQLTRFDELKRFVPSRKDVSLDSLEGAIGSIRRAISTIKVRIEDKAGNLANMFILPPENLIEHINTVNERIRGNNAKSTELREAVEKADEERKALQRQACSVFERDFVIRERLINRFGSAEFAV